MDAIVARIIDANLNRAREALRVMEDHARFGLDDAGICSTLKGLRHRLADAVKQTGLSGAICFRDTPGDVGTRLVAAGEYERESPGDVVRAAAKRLSEALRVIEEYGKIVDPRFAGEVEQLRYGGYEVEKRLVRVIDARARFGQVRLYVIVTESLCEMPWRSTVSAVIDGGADCVQLREKGLTDKEFAERAAECVSICRLGGSLCIINDRADVAAAVGADGVHVGQDDLGVDAVRRIVGPEAIVGISTHDVAQARAAAACCPDYVAVGPMYETPTKPQSRVAGPDTLSAVRRATAIPLVAIGGITPENLGAVLETGCRCVCVCSAVIGRADPAGAARAIRKRLAI